MTSSKGELGHGLCLYYCVENVQLHPFQSFNQNIPEAAFVRLLTKVNEGSGYAIEIEDHNGHPLIIHKGQAISHCSQPLGTCIEI